MYKYSAAFMHCMDAKTIEGARSIPGFNDPKELEDAIRAAGAYHIRHVLRASATGEIYFDGSKEYTVTDEKREQFDNPEGQVEHTITISKDGKPLLVSRHYQEFFVDYDDEDRLESQTIKSEPVDGCYLLGDDPLAKRVFEHLKGRRGDPNQRKR